MWADVLSASGIKLYEQCPSAYWHKAEAKTEPLPHGGSQVGKCFHNAMDIYITRQYTSTWDQAMDYALKHEAWFSDEVSNEARRIGNEWLEVNQKNMPKIVHDGNSVLPMAEILFGPPGDSVLDKKVKKDNYLKLDSGLSVHGFIDMIYLERDKKNQLRVVVADWKTSGWIRPVLRYDRQAQIYAIAAHHITDLPVRVEFYFVREPGDPPLSWIPTSTELEQAEHNLSVLQERIKLDVIHTPQPSVDCRWCSYGYACDTYATWLRKPTNGEKKVWHSMELCDLIDEYDKFHGKFKSSEEAVKILKKLVLTIMARERRVAFTSPITKVTYSIRRRSKRKLDDVAKGMINEFEGEDNIPPELQYEFNQHVGKSFTQPYLYKVKS